MKLFTLDEQGRFAPQVRLARFVGTEKLPFVPTEGILVWDGYQRGLLRLDRRSPPLAAERQDGTRFIHLADVGGWCPEQHIPPGGQLKLADALFRFDGRPYAGGHLVAVAAPGHDRGPVVRVRRTPERKPECWDPVPPKKLSLLPTQETRFVPADDPVHLLYDGYGETFRFTWDDDHDWVILTDGRGGPYTLSFAQYRQEQITLNEEMDREMTAGGNLVGDLGTRPVPDDGGLDKMAPEKFPRR